MSVLKGVATNGSITGLVTAGTGIIITGSGTIVSPYVITNDGANRTLSNLTSPTAINQSLLVNANSIYDLGTSINRWRHIYAQALRNSNTSIDVINLADSTLRDSLGNVSSAFSTRLLTDSTQSSVMDWENRRLFNIVGETLDFENGITYYNIAFGGNLSFSWGEGVLYDPDGNPAIDVGNRQIQWPSSGIPLLDFENGYLCSNDGSIVFNLTERTLKDTSGKISVDFALKYLRDFNEIISADWGTRRLTSPSGAILIDWSNNSGPTTITQLPGDNSTFIATTAFVQALGTQIINSLTTSINLKQEDVEVSKGWAIYSAIANTTAFSIYGHAPSVTDVGSSARNFLAATPAYSRAHRVAFATTAVAGNSSGRRQSLNSFYYSQVFNAYFEFGTETPGLTGVRAFIGLSATAGAPSNIDYTSLVNVVGIGRVAGNDNWNIIYNDNTGTASTINLGTGFPANTSFADQYSLKLSTTTANGAITYVVTRYASTGAVTSTTGILSTDLPVSNSPLYWQSQINNNTQATAVSYTLTTVKLEWAK